MNCEECVHYGGCHGITFTIPHYARGKVKIECEAFKQRMVQVDPNSTCGDCGCYIEHGNTDWWCGKHEYQLPRGLNTVACVKIEPKETTQPNRIAASNCPYRQEPDFSGPVCTRAGISTCDVQPTQPACEELP